MEKPRFNGNGNGNGHKTRIGVISRIDFPGEGFRRGLLELAKKAFAQADVQFVILAAGLISHKAVKDAIKTIRNDQRTIKREITKRKQRDRTNETRRKVAANGDWDRYQAARTERGSAEKELKALPKDAPEETRKELEAKLDSAEAMMAKRWSLRLANEGRRDKERGREAAEIKALELDIEELEADLKPFTPESMASYLASAIPEFTNADGKPVKLYIVPSSAYDGDVGKETAEALQVRRQDIIVYSEPRARFPITSADKVIEVLVPERKAWLRGDYDSTPVERLLKDRACIGDQDVEPAMFLVGGFGSSITKPVGEWPTPFCSVPVLSAITDVSITENQIGVCIMSVHRDHAIPLVHTVPFKDQVSRELEFIGMPRVMNDTRRSLIDVLKRIRSATTGTLSRETGLTEADVTAEMQSMASTTTSARNTSWPGVAWNDKERRWGFPHKWIQENLRYPEPSGERRTDSVLCYGCLHSGAKSLDVAYFLREVPKRILDHGATILVGAGDFVEGLEHNLLERGEVHPAFWNLTLQEKLAGGMVARVTMDVFNVRFPAALDRLLDQIGGRQPTDEELRATINEALLQNVMIEGNHDEWLKKHGATPLITMRDVMLRQIRRAIEKELDRHGMRTVGLDELVEKKIVILGTGVRYVLPSGLQMSVDHPGMARTKTTSIRAQSALAQNRESHVVVVANFHVGISVQRWDGRLGQRLCLQVGTLMLDTDFEHKKQKTVDHGFGFFRLVSVEGRVVEVTVTFYGYKQPLAEGKGLDPMEPFFRTLEGFGLNES